MLNAFRHHGCREVGPSSSPGLVWRCSTPFGITAVGSRLLPRAPGALATVLNAFRHHGCREPAGDGPGGLPHRVLNAFRHHGCRESRRAPSRTSLARCSTPFGITAVGSSGRGRARGSWACAQRLSASRLSGVGQRLRISLLIRVLNAFRYHGCRETTMTTTTTRNFRCSTPFGITAVGSRHGHDDPRAPRVLNAFRHHGCREVLAPAKQRLVCPRAQRLSASRLSGASRSRRAGLSSPCSTPFGITAVGRLPLGGLRVARGEVLNAFRHHGCREHGPPTAAAARQQCSTPFGITAVGRRSRCAPA